MPCCEGGSKKLVALLAERAKMNTFPVTIELPYEKFSCTYGFGTTPVYENESRSSGTTGGACSTVLCCSLVTEPARVLMPARIGMLRKPWKSKRQSLSSADF